VWQTTGMSGPDLPPPEQLFDVHAFSHRWPTGAEKAELVDGVLCFTGDFDERDLEIARRAYPGRRVTLGPDNVLEIYPAGSTGTIWDRVGGVAPVVEMSRRGKGRR
jgi:hypothetical protein